MTTKEYMEAKIQQLIAKCDRLTRERDDARWQVCELSGNGSIDSTLREAAARGWNLTEEDSDGKESH